jgi:hypothetical protein
MTHPHHAPKTEQETEQHEEGKGEQTPAPGSPQERIAAIIETLKKHGIHVPE